MKTFVASATALLVTAVALSTANIPDRSQQQSAGEAAKAAAKQRADKTTNQAPTPVERKTPCKTPENASLCYWTHGRLSYYSVNFTWLLWKIGTHRLLKICDEPIFLSMQSTGDCADPEFPENLQRIYEADRRRWKREGGHGDYYPSDVFADFEICPLEPERKGERQYACIESAKITFVRK